MRRIVLALLLVGTAQAEAELTIENALREGDNFTAYLVSYNSGGLRVHAMVAVPKLERPQSGFPVLIANHGYVPDPQRYGIGADGMNARPGDYYRPIPELYAARGFIVVMPDYRGHNSSEGYDQIKNQDRQNMRAIVDAYAADVTALMAHLDEIEHANHRRVYMWSHSMGGGVSMRALLATDSVIAASFWSTLNIEDLADQLADLDIPVVFHHSSGDQSTSFKNSVWAARSLIDAGQSAALHIYDVDEHFFAPGLRERAADDDTAFFLSH